MLKAIIFDMDGVLIDATKYIWMSFNQLLSDYGVNVNDEDIRNKYLGRSLRDQIKMIRHDYGIKEEIDISEFSQKATKIQLELLKDKIILDERIKNLIESAKNEGIKIAVATSSGKKRTIEILQLLGLIEKMDVIVTADDVENHKPNPDIFLKAAEQLGIGPKYCIVIEDALNGIVAAKNAKMKVIGLVTKYSSRNSLKSADLIIESFSEVNVDILKRLVTGPSN